MSVLTDQKYFQGSFEYLQDIRKAGVTCPLLCKEFIVEVGLLYVRLRFCIIQTVSCPVNSCTHICLLGSRSIAVGSLQHLLILGKKSSLFLQPCLLESLLLRHILQLHL